jgi:hypothetical protein
MVGNGEKLGKPGEAVDARHGSCVTSIAGPHRDAQLNER